jgi:D-galactose 1-dehydrogenase
VTKKIAIAIVGIGKIARDQHVPAIAHSADFELVAAASPSSRLAGVPCFSSIEQLFEAMPDLPAVALCTTPQVRYHAARYALARGCHVLLEKPPGATLSEVAALVDLAAQQRSALFATWHSRHASAVEPAQRWLAARTVTGVSVTWKEDVRVWHPGQTWIWRAGGLGVFDPGINALSILTRILPATIVLNDAELSYPQNCETPIAARLQLRDGAGAPIGMQLNFRHTGEASWDIAVQTDNGSLLLSNGGSALRIDERVQPLAPNAEYPRLYDHFASLIRARQVDVDIAPMRLVADALLCGRRIEVEPFIDG